MKRIESGNWQTADGRFRIALVAPRKWELFDAGKSLGTFKKMDDAKYAIRKIRTEETK